MEFRLEFLVEILGANLVTIWDHENKGTFSPGCVFLIEGARSWCSDLVAILDPENKGTFSPAWKSWWDFDWNSWWKSWVQIL